MPSQTDTSGALVDDTEVDLSRNSGSIRGLIAVATVLCATAFASAQPAPSDQGARHGRSDTELSPASAAEIWDANHDGTYTCDEWKSYLARLFDRADRNRDGSLTPKEFEGVRYHGSALAGADFGYFDENQDGKITRNEFVGKPNEFILQNDKNGDCRVTPDELKGSAPDEKKPSGRGKRG